MCLFFSLKSFTIFILAVQTDFHWTVLAMKGKNRNSFYVIAWDIVWTCSAHVDINPSMRDIVICVCVCVCECVTA